MDFPISTPYNDACASMSPGCPTAPNAQQIWDFNIPVDPLYDPIPSTFFECKHFFTSNYRLFLLIFY